MPDYGEQGTLTKKTQRSKINNNTLNSLKAGFLVRLFFYEFYLGLPLGRRGPPCPAPLKGAREDAKEKATHDDERRLDPRVYEGNTKKIKQDTQCR